MGWETAWYSEIEPYAAAVMKKRFPNAVNLGDVTKIDGRQAPPVDILCGGFPCQDISLAGKGAGLGGARSGLWSHYARLIDEIRPRWVVAENVSALRSRGLDTVLGELASLGYDAEWHCIPASAVGAPHRRDRIWIVAYPSGSGLHAPALAGLYRGEGTRGWDADRGVIGSYVADANRSGRGERRGGFTVPQELSAAQRHGETLPDTDEFGRDGRAGHIAEANGGLNLRTAVKQWPTPVVTDSIGARNKTSRRTAGGGEQTPRGNDVDGRDDRHGRSGAAGDGDGRQHGGWWAVEPDVGRVAHGVPSRVDRLRCLGNAVVPQVPFILFQAIAHAESSR